MKLALTSCMRGMRWLLGLSLCACALQAQAQATADATPRSPAQSLSCLQRPKDRPDFSQHTAQDAVRWLMRVQLRFERPDASPKIEVLYNDGVPESLQDQVRRYVASYRLPCMTAADGVVRAMQEFNFDNSVREPLPVGAADTSQFCVVAPRRDMEIPAMMSDKVQHVVMAMAFTGDGQQAPAVKVLYSSASSAMEDASIVQAKGYRMPCRTGAESPRTVQLHYYFRVIGTEVYKVPDEVLKLGKFLGLTEGVAKLDADFDFHSMNCPFDVNYTTYSPHLPNWVRTGVDDPNRAAFLKWLGERKLRFANDKQANDLFGQTFQIRVACGALHLHPKSAGG